MAKSSQSVESLIKSTFALQVAVRCTEEVETMCLKNNLKFYEILRPFCALSNIGEWKLRHRIVTRLFEQLLWYISRSLYCNL